MKPAFEFPACHLSDPRARNCGTPHEPMILAGRAGLDTCHDEARALSGVCTRRVPRCDVQGVNSPQQALHMRPGLRVLLTSGHAKTLLEDDDPPGALLSRPYRKNDLARAVDRRTDGGRYAP